MIEMYSSAPDDSGDLGRNLAGANALIQVNEAKVLEFRELLQSTLDVVDVSAIK